jgi:hypothetical protein
MLEYFIYKVKHKITHPIVAGAHSGTDNMLEECLGCTKWEPVVHGTSGARNQWCTEPVVHGTSIKRRREVLVEFMSDVVDFEKKSVDGPAVLTKEKSGKDRPVKWDGLPWGLLLGVSRYSSIWDLVYFCQV